MQEADVWRAVADPTRRRMLDMLVESKELAVGAFVEAFDVSQPAISQHLRVLRDAGLVEVRREGRRRLYHLRPAALMPLRQWLAPYEQFWAERFDRLGDVLDEMQEQE